MTRYEELRTVEDLLAKVDGLDHQSVDFQFGYLRQGVRSLRDEMSRSLNADYVRETLLGQVETKSESTGYGADADGNRGASVLERELLTTEATIEDFEPDDVVPMTVQVGEFEFRLKSLDPESGRAVYSVDFSD